MGDRYDLTGRPEPAAVKRVRRLPMTAVDDFAYVTPGGTTESFERLRDRLQVESERCDAHAVALVPTYGCECSHCERLRKDLTRPPDPRRSGLTPSEAAKKRWSRRRRKALGGKGRSSG